MRAPAPDSFARSRLAFVFAFSCLLALLWACGGGSALAAALPPAADGESTFHWNAFLGPFHMVLLHFPIGFIAAAGILEVFAWRRPTPEIRFAVRLLLWMAFASGVAASAAGLLRASEGGFDVEAATEHRNLAYTFVGATLGTAIASHFAGRPSPKPRWVMVFRTLLFVSLLLVGTAGHHGGNLTHGSDFLTAGAPPFIVKILRRPAGKPSPSAAQPGTTNQATATASVETVSARLYTDKIKPLFESRCYSCHGPEKHKGDYRLDVPESARRGGESGSPAITPGDPMKSNLLRLMLLPRDHDDAMPPEGKQSVTAEEILIVAHWMQAGAPFGTPAQ